MLQNLLLENKDAIVRRWIEMTLGLYPEDTQRLFKRQKDRFQNPIGYAVNKDIAALYAEFVGAMDRERIVKSLDDILRIFAIQDWPASKAVSFVFMLKDAIRFEIKKALEAREYINELYECDARVDHIARYAFDVYMACREKAYEIRLNEIKRQSTAAFKRFNREKTEE